MKKHTTTILSIFINLSLLAQPTDFTWQQRHYQYNYISCEKDQKEQGPCRIFASIAAVEAMSQIYFNKKSAELDLSESNLYNGGAQCFQGQFGCYGGGAANVEESLDFIVSDGIVDENCFMYPTEWPFCRTDCNDICNNPSQLVTIPGYQEINIETDQELKYAIIDYGPIIIELDGVGGILHPGKGCPSCPHTVLLLGWKTESELKWHIKSSWPDDAKIFYKSFDIFEYATDFYYVEYISGENEIECSGSDCGIFSSRFYEDFDGDGFYNWGIGPKPDNCPGTCLMDFDDNDQSHIYLDATTYSELPTPSITGPDLICHPDSDTFYFHKLPEDLTLEWEVTPSAYFNSPTSGTGDTIVSVTPNTPILRNAHLLFQSRMRVVRLNIQRIF